ncbi:sensor histidine kinase [Nocardia sp. alder85J]|uniref:sensor histidine kinase n=1 Tax=Nocardia sp. alder85J TaxID=2862949 RepID=UPI001CD5C58D|nr:histidine kinase [Nocardia sp. alder85J]MCX4094166.1 histidine kinase [Nocardia sp. alder85J]
MAGKRIGRPSRWTVALAALGTLAVLDGVLALWLWTSGDVRYFWPRWVWFGWAILISLVVAVRDVIRAPSGRRRVLIAHRNLYLFVTAVQVTAWALVGRGFFWPLWPFPIMTALLVVHWRVVRRMPPSRERELAERVDVLTRTRRDALDVRAAELERIERDLHDGAQARLVSVAMTLGLTEQLVARDPDAAIALVTEARAGALAALDELRTVMRGIHPPVLGDRGLVGALQALAVDLSVATTVTAALPARPPAPLESALYFAVSECLANVVKHSHAERAGVTLGHDDGRLSVVVVDDGVGGARLDGGTGLRGVARRLEAFDGTLDVRSPPGGPTEVIMELPCEW